MVLVLQHVHGRQEQETDVFGFCLESGQWPTVILNTAVMLFQHLKNLSYLLRHRFSSLKNQTARNILKRYESHKHLGEQNQQMNIRNLLMRYCLFL